MRQKKFRRPEGASEFELDLAPLLAVMVKLVPVLLVSSAFVQFMIIETELPQVVQEAIQQDEKQPEARVSLEVDPKNGVRLVIRGAGGEKAREIPLKDGSYDYESVHRSLVDVKKTHPKVFRMDLIPQGDVSYGDLVRFMDEARRSRDAAVDFPVQDSSGRETRTPYMFPQVVFANSLEG